VVASGGVDSGATVNFSAHQFVFGSAVGATLNLSGQQVVSAGGSTSGTHVNSGGFEVVYGTASGTILDSSGAEAILSGGIGSGAHVNSGGFEAVFTGGIASGAIISGGILDVKSGGSTGSGAVSFALSGGGTLLLEDSVNYGGLVGGFGLPDRIDFRDIPFGSGATTATVVWNQLTSGGNASGTLTVSGGGNAASITLLGQYVQGNFHSANDGTAFGGTLITDPPVQAQTDLAIPHPRA